MSAIWRSENMVLLEMTMQREAAHLTVERLGELGYVEFKDLSSHLNAFQRRHANEVKRCEELERILRFFQDQIDKSDMKFSTAAGSEEGEFEEEGAISEQNYTNILDSYESDFTSYEKELRELNENLDQMISERNQSVEYSYVIRLASQFFQTQEAQQAMTSAQEQTGAGEHFFLESETGTGTSGGAGLGYISGVVPKEKIPTFMLLIYRSTRGNVVPRFAEIDDPIYDTKTGKYVEKSVFTVFFGALAAKEKIKKVCEALGASIHDYPADQDIREAEDQVEQKIGELDTTINSTKSRMYDLLEKINYNLPKWSERVRREKAIYHTMNMFNYSMKGAVVAVGWCADRNVEAVQTVMDEAKIASNAEVSPICEVVQTNEDPPTYFETNKFTEVFQNIVNAYGVPRYKELNPAIISIISFPFLFAIMFGDFGHGAMLFAISLGMIVFEKSLIRGGVQDSEMFGMIFGGRYIMVLMGIFAVYTGLIYNDGFSLSLEIFPSKFKMEDPSKLRNPDNPMTYPFGIDPAWYGTSNKLLIYNSIKMKLSVIYGVGHMVVGLFFALGNMIYFRNWLDIAVEFIPEFIILMGTFGYMDFLIIYKWATDFTQPAYSHIPKNSTYTVEDCMKNSSYCDPTGYSPPSILQMMTNFFLKAGQADYSLDPMFISYGQTKDEARQVQANIQLALLLLVAFSVPVLLLVKPIYEHYQQKKRVRHQRLEDVDSDNSINGDGGSNPERSQQEYQSGEYHQEQEEQIQPVEQHDVNLEAHQHDNYGEGNEEEEEPFSELFIHQLIHTIEYVLGCVSNTASYLRLWALSLAHAQLSEVFWGMTLGLLMNRMTGNDAISWIVAYSGIGLFFVFAIWLLATIGVLLIMESLSAFLHALRLHWVEFQNKFYQGSGHLFVPFSFETWGKDI